jgi:hypothetical protein
MAVPRGRASAATGGCQLSLHDRELRLLQREQREPAGGRTFELLIRLGRLEREQPERILQREMAELACGELSKSQRPGFDGVAVTSQRRAFTSYPGSASSQ